MTASLTITLPCPPPVSAAFKNTSAKARQEAAARGRKLPGRLKTQRYRTWARAAGNELLTQRRHHVGGPVLVDITCARRQANEDVDNKIKVVLDFLVEMNVIDDDKNVQEVRARWGDVPGAVVTVMPLALESAA